MTENRIEAASVDETFVVFGFAGVSSEVTISSERGEQLEQAFRDGLHLVEAAPGFPWIEAWRDINLPGVFQWCPGGMTRRASATTCGRAPTDERRRGSRPNPNAPTAPVCAGTCVSPMRG